MTGSAGALDVIRESQFNCRNVQLTVPIYFSSDILEILPGKDGRIEIVDAGLISRLSTVTHELDTMSLILKRLTDVTTELRRG